MAFLDNSGDIILDAVLTDTGRMRLAKGDGSFRIVKFGLGDDEINYTRFNLNHASGSAYADLEILQTPILESFTNNTSLMNSKLITIPRNNLLFLPVLEINEVFSNATRMNTTTNSFVVAVDNTTETEFATNTAGTSIDGILFGEDPAGGGNYVRIDQGLDTTAIAPARVLDPLLVETQYVIEMDNRLGSIVSINGNPAPVSYIDDDQVATYVLSLGTNTSFVSENNDTSDSANQSISGPRGTTLKFKILSSLEINTSTYLFDTLGTTSDLAGLSGTNTGLKTIDAIVRVSGGTTGYRVDIPIRLIKKTS
jgi:hypothetical protein